MEPFALTCTTCKTRLKVRDPAAIGQIMACPKCGGMVLVKAPEPGPLPARGSSASGVIGNDSNETKPDQSHPLKPPQVSPVNYQIKPDAFDDVDELLGNVPARNMVPTPTVRHSPTNPQARSEHTPPPPPLGQTIIRPVDQKQSPDSQAKTISQNDLKVQQPAAKTPAHTTPAKSVETPQRAAVAAVAAPLAAATVAVVTSAAMPAAAAASDSNANSLPLAPDATATGLLGGSLWKYWAMVSASALLGVVLAVWVVAFAISWSSDPTIVAQPPVPPAPQPEAPVKPAPSVVPAVEPKKNPENVATKLPSPPKAAPPEVAPPAPNPMPMPPMPTPLPERDPLGLTDPPGKAPVKPSLPADDPLNKTIDKFLGGPDNPNPQEVAPAAPKPALPPIEEDPAPPANSNALTKPQPRHVDVAARFADPLPSIDLNATPLVDFLQMMQDMSTIPITLRPDGLAMVRLTPYSPDTPITWKGAATSMGGAIQGAVQPLGLEAKIEADQLVIDVASPQLATTKLNVKDLTGSEESRAAELSAILQAFVAPDSWGEEDSQPTITASKDELVVRQHRQPLAQCVLLLEKLRVARGLPPASKFEPKLFELTTRSEQAAKALATPITLNFSIPTPLARVTERLGKAAGVRILIDWQSLAAAGWNPDGDVTLTVEKKPLSFALTDLTTRMELAWRIVDGRTIQILSPQTLAERTELEFYPVAATAPNEAAGAALVAKIRTTLGGQNFRDAGGRGELRYDPVGKCLIALLSQPQQVQLQALLPAK